jgi:hypothetical protein
MNNFKSWQEFNDLPDDDKKKYLKNAHRKEGYSLREIAKAIHTYPTKVKKLLADYNIEIMSKSESISLALQRTDNHPTRGKKHSKETIIKLGESVAKSWKNPSEARQQAIENSKERWSKLDHEERTKHTAKASKALSKTLKEGSRLEKYLKEQLFKAGYTSIDHKTCVLPNEKLEFDLYVGSLSTIIEVDGPVHSEPIFGEETYHKTVNRDDLKTGLALDAGLKMVRVKQNKNYSQTYFRELAGKLLDVLAAIKGGSKQTLFIVE